MIMRLHYLQHVSFEDPAWLLSWAESRCFKITSSRLYESEPLPEIDAFDLLIVMGGPMSVGDVEAYPWLAGEKRFIRRAIDADRHVLGICLGAQLIADVLGADVYPNPQKEIGWWSVDWTEAARKHAIGKHLPETSTVFQWHGDTFDLPNGSVHLAKSDVCPNQAFLFQDRVMGLQFHMESTLKSIGKLIDNCRDELVNAPFIQSESEMPEQAPRNERLIHNAFEPLLDAWLV
jgi:GMP synthase (glutamine-hydrolysing)